MLTNRKISTEGAHKILAPDDCRISIEKTNGMNIIRYTTNYTPAWQKIDGEWALCFVPTESFKPYTDAKSLACLAVTVSTISLITCVTSIITRIP